MANNSIHIDTILYGIYQYILGVFMQLKYMIIRGREPSYVSQGNFQPLLETYRGNDKNAGACNRTSGEVQASV